MQEPKGILSGFSQTSYKHEILQYMQNNKQVVVGFRCVKSTWIPYSVHKTCKNYTMHAGSMR